MNKTVFSFVVGLILVGVNTYAMEDGTASIVKEAASKTVPVMLPPVVPEAPAICCACPIKMTCQKAMAFCKRHPVCIAAGVAVAAAVIICNVVPAVKQKVRALFGIESTKQSESIEADTHAFPQEKIEVSEPAK